MNPARQISPFYRQLIDEVRAFGGYFNAHTHLDRAGTMDERYWKAVGLRVEDNSAISLHEKHRLIHDVHCGPAYEVGDLRQRVSAHLEAMVALDTRRVDTLADCTADGVGLRALDTLLALKKEWADRIDMRVAAYSPLGFPVNEPERWELFLEAAAKADFISALPESDELDEYPGHIGFEEHARRMLKVALSQGKMIHVHTDQRNEPGEAGTERVLKVMREEGYTKPQSGEPLVWMVHMVSPSTYNDARFQRMMDEMLDLGVGVISCPSAALGMRQLRAAHTPTYNSIPRILELVAAGIPVRLGSDNISDMCSPSTTADLGDEVFTLSAAIRYYNPAFLARLACGVEPDDDMRRTLREHLHLNDRHIASVLDLPHLV
jgi:cytosine/creatinine deaminase